MNLYRMISSNKLKIVKKFIQFLTIKGMKITKKRKFNLLRKQEKGHNKRKSKKQKIKKKQKMLKNKGKMRNNIMTTIRLSKHQLNNGHRLETALLEEELNKTTMLKNN